MPGGGSHTIFIKAGMDDSLFKPYQPQDLIAVVKKWLGDDLVPVKEEVISGVPEGQHLSVVFDKARALTYADGDEKLLGEIAQIFLDDYPMLLSKIGQAIANRDCKALEYSAHTLKGASGNLCAGSAFNAALRLEVIGRDGDLSQAGEVYEMLKKEIERLEPALKTLGY